MANVRFCVCLFVAVLMSSAAFAKTETLAERGKRLCEEQGVSLEDCTALPPTLRGDNPSANAASTTPEQEVVSQPGPGPAGFGTGTYGWCEDCTSLLAAAPVRPWSSFGGPLNLSPHHDEDGFIDAGGDDPSTVADSSPVGGGDAGEGDGSDGVGDGDDGEGDEGEGGDDIDDRGDDRRDDKKDDRKGKKHDRGGKKGHHEGNKRDHHGKKDHRDAKKW